MTRLRWRDDDEDAETAWHDRVGELFALDDEVDETWFLAPPVQVGWRRPATFSTGTRVSCFPCTRGQSTVGLEPVYRESIYAHWRCAHCGHRLDEGAS